MNHISFIPFPVLETEKLILRRIAKSDARYIFQLRSDMDYARLTGIKRYESVDEAFAFVEKIDQVINKNEAILWSIFKKDTEDYIGGGCLWNFSEDGMQAEIGYDLLPDFRGEGYIQEATRSVIEYGFDDLKLGKIVAQEVRAENIKSAKVLEGNGFQLEKTFEEPRVDGSLDKRLNYELLENQFRTN